MALPLKHSLSRASDVYNSGLADSTSSSTPRDHAWSKSLKTPKLLLHHSTLACLQMQLAIGLAPMGIVLVLTQTCQNATLKDS
uniref:Uncharacterized protein n=1 Tax=Cucumis melo TaxID=3656 RepID=A0A9I9D8V9_CUCME